MINKLKSVDIILIYRLEFPQQGLLDIELSCITLVDN